MQRSIFLSKKVHVQSAIVHHFPSPLLGPIGKVLIRNIAWRKGSPVFDNSPLTNDVVDTSRQLATLTRHCGVIWRGLTLARSEKEAVREPRKTRQYNFAGSLHRSSRWCWTPIQLHQWKCTCTGNEGFSRSLWDGARIAGLYSCLQYSWSRKWHYRMPSHRRCLKGCT